MPLDVHPGFWALIWIFLLVNQIMGYFDISPIATFFAFGIAAILRKVEYEFNKYTNVLNMFTVWNNFYDLWLKDGNFPMSGNGKKDAALHDVSKLMGEKE